MSLPGASSQLIQAWQERLGSLQVLIAGGGSTELLAIWHLRARLLTFLLVRYGQPIPAITVPPGHPRLDTPTVPDDRVVPAARVTPPSVAAAVRSRRPLAQKLASLRE